MDLLMVDQENPGEVADAGGALVQTLAESRQSFLISDATASAQPIIFASRSFLEFTDYRSAAWSLSGSCLLVASAFGGW